MKIKGYEFIESYINRVGIQTLIASGNCFSALNNKDHFAIVNMSIENLEYLLEQKIVEFPIRVLVVKDTKDAFIVDERIPEDFYREDYCSSCPSKNYNNIFDKKDFI